MMQCLKSDYTANTDLAPFKSNCQNFKARGCARERQLVKCSTTTTTCCAECTAHKPRLTNENVISQQLSPHTVSNILSVPHRTYNYGFISRMFCYAMFVMTRQIDTNFVDVSRRVLKSKYVEIAVKKAAREQLNNNVAETETDNSELNELEAEERSRVLRILIQMRTCISAVLCRIAGWILFKLFSRILTKVYVNNGQIEMLRRCRTTANVPIIYLPLHRSHLDYILLTFILYMNNIKPPLVAAGDNLLIPFFGNLMRGLGAFFIRRRLDYKSGKRDHVYRAVLQQYMKENLREGHSLEFFIEGGRSRSGKALMPKSGLLSVVVDAILEGIIDNAYIVPVSMSYEKIFDGSFASEQLGKPKISESFTLAFRSIWSTLRTNFGAVRVDFCQPYSLKDYLEHSPTSESKIRDIDAQTNNCVHLKCAACSGFRIGSFLSSQFSVDTVALLDKRSTIEKLAEHVVYDAFNSTTLMATHMVAFLLLTKHRKGVTISDLAQSLDWLRDECYRRKRDIGFSGDSKDAIRHAIVLLGKQLISINKMSFIMSTAPSNTTETANNDINMKIIFVKPTIKLPHVHDLQYFSNSCVTLFQMNSIVSNSLSSIISSPIDCLTSCGNNDISNITIDYDELINKSLLLCDILQFDFIFVPPCQNVQNSIHSTIEEMKRNGMLIDAQLNETVNQRLRDRFRLYDIEEEEDNDGYYSDRSGGGCLTKREMRIILTEKNINRMEFYLSILAPYIESYWLAACALIRLIGSRKKIDRVFYAEMIEMAKDKLTKRLLNYEECISMDTFRNAVKLFEKWKIVQIESLDNGSKQISLNAKYNCENAIDEVILKIENYKIRSSY